MTELLILGLETATLAGSIAVLRGSKILTNRNGNPGVSHSNTLLTDIDEVLTSIGKSIKDIDLFAVASGPGSFTGLRIGLATVKALTTTLDRPAIGIPTLDAIAHSAGVSQATVAMLPAGRGEVFVQMLTMQENGEVMALDDARHLPPVRAIENYLDRGEVLWAGDGAQNYSNVIREFALKAGYSFISDAPVKFESRPKAWVLAEPPLSLAEHVALLAVNRVQDQSGLTANSLRAMYVRPSDAEIKV
ncbi:MAG TPA: tRNA (adenosine(37)-N6)-threonylcarbamoyltransferase complex dimerization subunit type 1 TsaB [Pyrinomonadaceae bacterium]|nr:tRNA (adenosine(37)-N6)-threonylcarbamoyltransferase complex dimerization subunit type 1 TsaB [Pyrinomonadaceae bacterium]